MLHVTAYDICHVHVQETRARKRITMDLESTKMLDILENLKGPEGYSQDSTMFMKRYGTA